MIDWSDAMQADHQAALKIARSEARRTESALRNKLSVARSKISDLTEQLEEEQKQRNATVEEKQKLQKDLDEAHIQIRRLTSQFSEEQERNLTLTSNLQGL